MPRAHCRLLVSVFAPEEVAAALEGGADIIDVKDPAAGALGRPSSTVLRGVCRAVAGRAPISLALGDQPHAPAGGELPGVDYVKAGLLGAHTRAEATDLLRAVAAAAGAARVVGVGFVDAEGGLPLDELPGAVHAAGARVAMLDTLGKNGPSSIARLGWARIAAFVDTAQALGLEVALAGSLGAADLTLARELGADIVGVRGAACTGGRLGQVSAARVRVLVQAIAGEPIDRLTS